MQLLGTLITVVTGICTRYINLAWRFIAVH